jgi:hypothetical protein
MNDPRKREMMENLQARFPDIPVKWGDTSSPGDYQ